MIPRMLISVSLVVVLVLFAGVSQNVGSGLAQDNQSNPNAPLGTSFTYQGMLTDSNDNPINGSCDFEFSLYDADTGGSQVGTTQGKTAVPVTKGAFTVTLDFGSGAFSGDARWLEVTVRCPTGSGSFTPLSPRQQLTAVPYATFAQAVGSHSHWGDTWSGTGTGLTLNGGDNGMVGTGSEVGVYGFTNVTSGNVFGIYGVSDSDGGKGVKGWARATSGGTYGVVGQVESPDGTGVYGTANATSGPARGVIGISASTQGNGVWGYATATNGITYGVSGRSDSPEGIGVYGGASATSGDTYGVYGRSDSTDGNGVYGYASATSGVTYGIFGVSDSTEGIGLYGRAPFYGVKGFASDTSGYNYGVVGGSSSTNGTGVWGEAPIYGVQGLSTVSEGYSVGVHGTTMSMNGRGVLGYASNESGWGIGVYGIIQNSSHNYGLYTPDNLWSLNYNLKGAVRQLVQNNGDESLEVGDVVVFNGVLASTDVNEPPVILVTKAETSSSTAVAGVVYAPSNLEGFTLEGAAQPGEYLLIVVQGPARVKVSAAAGAIQPGDLLSTYTHAGFAARAAVVSTQGVQATLPGTVFAKALEALERGEGWIYVYVTLQ